MNAEKPKLSDLPNIGKVVAEKLTEVGVETPEQLFSMGSQNVFLRLKTVDPGACLSMLCGLEGAIQGVRWHNLDAAKKQELRIFYNSLKK